MDVGTNAAGRKAKHRKCPLNPRRPAPRSGAGLLWGLMELLWWRRRGRLLPVLAALSAAALAVLVFDHYNILVHYERWLDRGMPLRWMH